MHSDPVLDAIRDVQEAFDPTLLFERVVGRPAAFQREMLNSTSSFILLNAARQSGKSSGMACKIAHTCKYEPGSLCVITAPAERQTKEILRKVIDFKDALRMKSDRSTQLEIEFANGSRVVGVPSSSETVRGFSNVRILAADEFAFFQDGAGGHTILAALLPALARNGVVIGASTPNGRGNAFYDYWHEPRNEVQRIRAAAVDIPHLKEKAERAKAWMPLARWRVEYELVFEGSGNPFFQVEMIRNALVEGEPLCL